MDRTDFEKALAVSRETGARFEAWRALLQKWNPRINLVGPGTLADFWRRHALDGAQLVDHAPAEARLWADLGSGGGAPGLAVALILQDRGVEGARVMLVESNAKKAAFLRQAVRATGAPAVVAHDRVENLHPERIDVVTARAFAPLTRLLEAAHMLCKTQKSPVVGLFLKGRGFEAELTEARKSWRFALEAESSRSDPDGRIARIEGLAYDRADRPDTADYRDRQPEGRGG